jgi:hypothetical protein
VKRGFGKLLLRGPPDWGSYRKPDFAGSQADAPVALGKVYKIGREKVNDPCALGKIGFLAGMTMVANGADPGVTVALLTQGATPKAVGMSNEVDPGGICDPHGGRNTRPSSNYRL